MQQPFRFGVVTERAQSGAEWRTKAKKAEDLGYATFLVPDHNDKDIAPVAAMMAAADATTTLRIGSFVFNNDLRHPGLLAKEVATLDLFSEGRFEFGLGAGYLPSDYNQLGIPFERAGTRISRFEEALYLIKKLLTEEMPVTFSGNFYSIEQAKGLPRPVQKPHPPIYIGGGGERVLSFAAKQANIVGFAPKNSQKGLNMKDATAEAMTKKVEWVRTAAGECFSTLELSCIVFRIIITDHRVQAMQRAAGHIGLSVEEVATSPHLLIGSIDEIVADLQERRAQHGISYIEILEEYTEQFAPVVARLAGT
ncbi:MAG TPA: LLM class F420-dependent oxidoreductase [Ktedonobacter sp.]|jgi:probable F420-dependent oxidoreductase|nr:LLM class F420-dependent oxidoreductase [Ktedonobacter sp.]HAT47244.1 LLM class F420-dependent oxidoreductase [Ktedonobacter sp.]HBE26717.1 LLM class F420-dependent oxidoreductase [Ktedonobacter sp.]HCF86024.1 LLM class F420-dependent oxidoreductase [Ktedonobacter sp.]HCP74259.1 LLM class F420-dependent oxidoreductase [Ktedonobacter sp.]